MSGLGAWQTAVRPGRAADACDCARIAAACALQFRDSPQAWMAERPAPPPARHAAAAEAGRLSVALLREAGRGERLAGFAQHRVEPKSLHIEELAVDPRLQRQGLARALLEAEAQRARALGLQALTLSAFADVVWNAPALARMGFAPLPRPDWTEACRTQAEALAAEGGDVSTRVAMIRRL